MDRKVVSLELPELSLQGILVPELGQLIHLQNLILLCNNFHGTIPKELGKLENLEELDLVTIVCLQRSHLKLEIY